MSVNPCDFAILTVLTTELGALRSQLGQVINGSIDHATLGKVYTLSMPASASTSRVLKGVMVSIDRIGRIESALTTMTMLRKWQPRYIILVGIAGGFEANGVSIGDIIVSTKIVDYAVHKVTSSGIELRPDEYSIDTHLLYVAKELVRDGRYSYIHNGVQFSGRVHFGPIASGDQIVASSTVKKILLEKEPLLLGVEMEGAGVAAAVGHVGQSTRFIVVRGVADLADESKSDAWVDKACIAAASFAVDFISAAAKL